MTNQQGAPEALRRAKEITELMCSNEAAARRIAAAADELCRLHYENQRLAALVEAQRPAPSAAVEVGRATVNRAAVMDWFDQRGSNWVTYDDLASLFHTHPTPQADSQPASTYSIDADTQGIRARVADAITGALAFGAQGAQPPPTGHWLAPFWEMAREEVIRASRAPADSVTAPAGFVPVAAFDRLHAHAESLAARLLAASPTPPAPAQQQAAPKAEPGELSADSLRHQNKLLAETLGACILASGIVRKDIDGFTGPELLRFGEDLRSMLEAAPQQEAQEPSHRETVDVVGVRSNGEHVNLGKIAMPPRMKAREIAIEQFGSFKDDDGSDAEMCFGALEYFLEWLIQQGWSKAPQPAPTPLSDDVVRDAARYEYLRDCTMGERNRLEHYSGPALDVVIDAARKQGANHD